MYGNILSSRQAYTESNYANGIEGMYKLLQVKPVFYLIKYMPAAIMKRVVPPFMESRMGTWFMRKVHCDWQTETQIQRTSGLGSHAKVVGTDAGVENGMLALDLMGQAGLRLFYEQSIFFSWLRPPLARGSCRALLTRR